MDKNPYKFMVSSLKIVSIGTSSYLALISIDYLDKLTDKEIVNLNKGFIKAIKEALKRFKRL